jgi:hypothetical protein
MKDTEMYPFFYISAKLGFSSKNLLTKHLYKCIIGVAIQH